VPVWPALYRPLLSVTDQRSSHLSQRGCGQFVGHSYLGITSGLPVIGPVTQTDQ